MILCTLWYYFVSAEQVMVGPFNGALSDMCNCVHSCFPEPLVLNVAIVKFDTKCRLQCLPLMDMKLNALVGSFGTVTDIL